MQRRGRRCMVQVSGCGCSSQIPLAVGERVTLDREFHVEILRGGMNRLLLRSRASPGHSGRVEVLFQNVQHLDMPMEFDALDIEDVTETERADRTEFRGIIRGAAVQSVGRRG